MEVGQKYKHLEDKAVFEVIEVKDNLVTLQWEDPPYKTIITVPQDSQVFETLFEQVEIAGNHERQLLYTILRYYKARKPIDGKCPKYHPGHGYWHFSSHRKMAYNDFNTVTMHTLQQMFNEASAQVHPHLILTDAPYTGRGAEDEAEWEPINIYGNKVLISIRRRGDGWYDFCLTVFAIWDSPEDDTPDIS